MKSTETPSTKKIDTTKLSKINVVQNELSGDDDDNYNEYSDYYEDDEELTKVSDKSTSIAPETKPADKDVKFRSIERTKVSPIYLNHFVLLTFYIEILGNSTTKGNRAR